MSQVLHTFQESMQLVDLTEQIHGVERVAKGTLKQSLLIVGKLPWQHLLKVS